MSVLILILPPSADTAPPPLLAGAGVPTHSQYESDGSGHTQMQSLSSCLIDTVDTAN